LLTVAALLSISGIFNKLFPMVLCTAAALTIGRIAHLLIRVVPGRPKFVGAVSAHFVVHAITIDGIELFESIRNGWIPLALQSKLWNWTKHSDSRIHAPLAQKNQKWAQVLHHFLT
jgi:hypothetical protein